MTVGTKVMDKVSLKNGHDIWYGRYGAVDALSSYIMVHGGAGSHEDFQDLSPLLVHDDFNVIALDLPGNGRTSAEAAGGEKLTENRLIDTVIEVLRIFEARNSRWRFILVGHSFGGGTVMNVAARGNFDSLVGLALFSSCGFRPHKRTRPYWFNRFLCQLLVLSPFTRFFIMRILHVMAIYVVGLSPKVTLEESTYMYQRGGSIDFSGIKTCAESIYSSKLPVFQATARNDKVVEKAISDEITAVLKPAVKIEFDGGGHNIQRTRAAELAQAIVAWTACIPPPPSSRL
ncbi:hypothetical protein AC1031_004819 [Aphanomyces cochlioides]|nr:hypothetical protein AC1031_004819 [Aphanomyces cochlioides]